MVMSSRLHDADGSPERVDRSLGRRRGVAGRNEHAKVHKPCTAVELGVDGVDEEGLGGVVLLVLGLHDDDAGDELRRESGAPADDDCIARMPELEDLEGDRGLRTLTNLESRETIESWLTELLG